MDIFHLSGCNSINNICTVSVCSIHWLPHPVTSGFWQVVRICGNGEGTYFDIWYLYFFMSFLSVRVSSQSAISINGNWTAFISSFSNQWPLGVLYNTASHSPVYTHIHPFIHTFTTMSSKATVSSSGVFMFLCVCSLVQRVHLNLAPLFFPVFPHLAWILSRTPSACCCSLTFWHCAPGNIIP